MSDMYGYIGIETLLNFCENSVDHAATPNDFMRMPRVRMPERKTGNWVTLDSDSEIYEDIKCPFCGHTFTVDVERMCDIGFIREDLKYCPNCGVKMIRST